MMRIKTIICGILILGLLLLTACNGSKTESAAVFEDKKGGSESEGRIIPLEAYNWGFILKCVRFRTY